jgi:peptide/nickel transport system permease protein
MPWFLLKRLLALAATLAVASALVFSLLEWLPGNAAEVMLGETATPQAVAALQARLGLDQSPARRYLRWLGGWLQGRTELSLSYGTPTASLIAERLPVTLPLAFLAMVLTAALAAMLGLFAATRPGRAGDTLVMATSQLGLAVPGFWLAIGLVLLFSVHLHWLRAGGFPGWTAATGGGPLAALGSLLLPAVALALSQAAVLARVLRASLLELLHEDFMRTARAKGLSRRAALWRHALRNALIPVLTVAGLQLANLVAGTVVIEKVFVLPGLGQLVFEAVGNRDLVLVRDVVMLLVTAVVLLNFGVDALCAWADPRRRRA